jgi:membrane-bound metal-dependent hydrolase YbcI (DUF457 family)
MPDWAETFTGYWGWTRAEFLANHRGITHSLAGAAVEIPLLIVAIGLIARAWRRWGNGGSMPTWRWLSICVTVTFLSHLFMDWQGSYGWRPFLPWSGTWYYLDWVAIADPFFWLVPLVALAWGADRHWIPLAAVLVVGAVIWLIIGRYVLNGGIVSPWVIPLALLISALALVGWIRYWFGPVARQRLATFAVLILALYSVAQGVVVQQRKRDIRQLAEGRFGSAATWAALTNLGQPFKWEAIYADSDTVAGERWRLPRQLREQPVARALDQTVDGRAMQQFARFLTAEVDTTNRTIYLRDARYARAGRSGWGVLAVRMEQTRRTSDRSRGDPAISGAAATSAAPRGCAVRCAHVARRGPAAASRAAR